MGQRGQYMIQKGQIGQILGTKRTYKGKKDKKEKF